MAATLTDSVPADRRSGAWPEPGQPYPIGPEIGRAYWRDGAALLPGLTSAAWCRALIDGLDALIAENGASSRWSEIRVNAEKQTSSVRFMAWDVPVFAAFVRQTHIAAAIAAILGTHELRFWHDNFFCKEGDHPDGGTAWHHDISAWPFVGEMVPSLWFALTDVPIENAPLVTILGSHLTCRLRYKPPRGREGLGMIDGYAPHEDLLELIARTPDSQKRIWPCNAGDAILIHPNTLHASMPRKARAGRRIGYTTRWLGDDIRWAPNEYSTVDPRVPLERVVRGAKVEGDEFPFVYPMVK